MADPADGGPPGVPSRAARLASLAGLVIGALGVAFVVVRVVRDRAAVADALDGARPGWLALAVVAGAGAIALIGVNWVALLRRAGAVRLRRGLGWFCVGQLGKYVPGGIWPIVGQAELARRGGVGRSAAYGSTAVSMLATLLGAVATAAAAGLAGPPERRAAGALLALGLAAGFAALAAPPLRRAVAAGGRRALGRAVELPDAATLAIQLVRHLPVWVLFSIVNVLVVVALGGSLDAAGVVELGFVTCVSWIAGFVIVGLPGGIGVREAVFTSLATALLGAGLAVPVAVVGRLVTVVVDLALAALAAPLARSGRVGRAPRHAHR